MNVNQHKHNYKPNFGQKIIVTSSLDASHNLPLCKLRKEHKEVTSWQVENGKFLDEGFTTAMSVCNGVFLSNHKKGFLAHMIPNGNSEENIAKYLINAIEKLKKGKTDLTALIVGGSANSESSREKFEVIKDVLNKEKIQYSTAWGSKKKHGYSGLGTNVYASAKDDLSVIHAYNFRGDKAIKMGNITDLKNFYEDVYISPKDHLDFKF